MEFGECNHCDEVGYRHKVDASIAPPNNSFNASGISLQSNANLVREDGIVLSDVPRKVDTRARYLFYLHGYIVEAGNTRPTSPKFGDYEYEQILETFKQEGFIVIS